MTIDGLADVGYQAINYKGNSVTGFAGNGANTSQFNIRVTEDLGGGLKANFRMENDFSVNSNNANSGTASSTIVTNSVATTATTPANSVNSTAGTFGNGEIRAGLASATFGEIQLGTVNFNGLTTQGVGQPYGTAIGSGYNSVWRLSAGATSVNGVRDENSFKYISPTFSGLTATLYKSNKQTKASTIAATASTTTGLNAVQTNYSTALGAYDKLGSQELGLNYANGPVAASFSNLKQDFKDVGTGVTESTVNTLGANYTAGAFKGYFFYQTNKNTGAATTATTVDTKFSMLTGQYTTGANVFYVSTGSLTADAGTYAGKKSKITSVGYDYNLSKLSNVYVRYESIQDDASVIAAAATIDGTDTKRTRTAVGIKVGF